MLTIPLKISIVTPTLGAGKWLPLCVRSVRDQLTAQDGPDWAVEHIVINALPQQANEVAQACAPLAAEADGRYTLRLVNEQDGGMYEAINKGFRISSGQVIAWLNSDEQYLAGALAAVVRFMRATPDCDLCAGDTVLLDRDLQPVGYRQAVVPDYRFIQAAYLNLQSCSMFLRREWFERGHILPTDWKTISDAVWIVDLLKAGLKVGLIKQPLACFTFTGKNLGQSAQALREVHMWHLQSGQSFLMRACRKLQHYLRECLAGARARRDVSIAVHLLDDGTGLRALRERRKVSPRFRQDSVASISSLLR